MRFSQHLSSHLTPEWRTHYINYDVSHNMVQVANHSRNLDFVSFQRLKDLVYAVATACEKRKNRRTEDEEEEEGMDGEEATGL